MSAPRLSPGPRALAFGPFPSPQVSVKPQAASRPAAPHPGNRRTALRTPSARSDHLRTAFTKGAAILVYREDPTSTALGVPDRVTEDGERLHRVLNLRITASVWALRVSRSAVQGDEVKRKHSPSYHPSQSGATLGGGAHSSQAPMQAPPRLLSGRLSRGLRPRARPGRLQYGGGGRREPGILAE